MTVCSWILYRCVVVRLAQNVCAHRVPEANSSNARRPVNKYSDRSFVSSTRLVVLSGYRLDAKISLSWLVIRTLSKIDHQNLASSTTSRLAPSQVPQRNQVPKYPSTATNAASRNCAGLNCLSASGQVYEPITSIHSTDRSAAN